MNAVYMPKTVRRISVQSKVARGGMGAVINRLLICFIVVGHLYYWYRYPLQISSAGTSQTYADTPLALQVGRYVLAGLYAGALGLAILGGFRGLKFTRKFIFLALAGTVIFAITLVKVLWCADAGDEGTVGFLVKAFYVTPLAIIGLICCQRPELLDSIEKWLIRYPTAYHVLFSVVQIVLWKAAGRLPALGYEGGLVRFGAGWDDPNGFGMFLLLPLTIALLAPNRNIKERIFNGFWMLTLGVLLVMTVSYSAIFGCLIGFVLFVILTRRGIFLAVMGGVVLAAALSISDFRTWVVESREQKLGSVDIKVNQAQGFKEFFDRDVGTVLFGGGSHAYFAENFYQLVLFNFGVIGLSILVCWLIATVCVGMQKYYQARRFGNFSTARTILVGTCFVAGVSAGSLGIPYFGVYPVNYFFWIYGGLIWLLPIGADAPARRPSLTNG